MPGPVIETAIGMALLFLAVALVCSAVVEAIANLVRKRAKYLLRGIRELVAGPGPDPGNSLSAVVRFRIQENELYAAALQQPAEPAGPTGPTGQDLTMELMRHPLVAPMKHVQTGGGATRNPSYLSARTFATALLDIVVPDVDGTTTIDQIRGTIMERVPESVPLRGAVLALLKEAGNDIDRLRTGIEYWYDAQMDRISGAYKRWAKRWLIVIGVVAAAVLNIDALQIGLSLHDDQPLREAVVAAAGNGTLCAPGDAFDATRRCVTDQLTRLQAVGLPIGWSDATTPDDLLGWIPKVLGLGLTAAAASLGAPFWFGVLNRVTSVRNTGGKPRSTTS